MGRKAGCEVAGKKAGPGGHGVAMRWVLMRFVVFEAVRGGVAGAVGVIGRAEEMEGRLVRRREALEGCLEKGDPDQRSLLMQAYGEVGRIREVAQSSGRTVPGLSMAAPDAEAERAGG
jgi:hypothetical protein